MSTYIDIREVRGHYEIYVNGIFHSSADDWKEVQEELDNIHEIMNLGKEN